MSETRHRKLSTGATLRPPLHRTSSDSGILNITDVSNDQMDRSRNRSKTHDLSSSTEIIRSYDTIDTATPERTIESSEEEDEGTGSEDDNLDHNESDGQSEIRNLRKFQNISDIIPGFIPERADISHSNVTKNSLSRKFVVTCVIILGGITSYFVYPHTPTRNIITIETVRLNFPTQDEELWTAFESGVQDVVRFNKPVTYILLYEEDAEDTLTNLVEQMSNYATCKVTECDKEPITLTDSELNSSEVVRNYGLIIENYKSPLQDRGVMIVKNLEKVRGVSAQAFHALCDEFTPLVDKSVFIFTMKVDVLPGYSKKMKFVEDYFKNNWNDVKIDILNALITRITSMVLEVHA